MRTLIVTAVASSALAVGAMHAASAHAAPTFCTYDFPVAPPGQYCVNYSPGGGLYNINAPTQAPTGPTWDTGPGSAACSSYHPAAFCGPTRNPFH